MVRNPIFLFASIAGAACVLVAAAAVTFLLLGSAGTYETGVCAHPFSGAERDVETEEPQARSFDVKWEEMNVQAEATQFGRPVKLTESEVTSRADELMGDDLPVDDLTICFHEGYAEAFAHAKLPVLGWIPLLGGLFETSARARGTIDFSGPYAVVTLTEFDIDDVPGFVEDRLRDDAEDEANKALETLPLQHNYNVNFHEGAADTFISR